MPGAENVSDYANQIPINELVSGAAGGAAAGAILAGMMVFLIIAVIVGTVIMAIPLWKLSKRFSLSNAWLSWVPIVQIVMIFRIANKPWWWVFGVLAVFVPFIGGIAVAAFMVYIWYLVAERTGHPAWLGILMIIPLVNIVLPYYFAFAKPTIPTAPMAPSSQSGM